MWNIMKTKREAVSCWSRQICRVADLAVFFFFFLNRKNKIKKDKHNIIDKNSV